MHTRSRNRSDAIRWQFIVTAMLAMLIASFAFASGYGVGYYEAVADYAAKETAVWSKWEQQTIMEP